MNRYLGVLIPGTSFTVYEDRFGQGVRALALEADPERQSPRIYSAFVEGGGVIFDPDAAKALEGAGFTVTVFTPTEAELAYLGSFDPMFRSAAQLYLVTCPTPRAVRQVGGRRTCGRVEGLKRIDFDEAKSMGVIRSSDVTLPRGWVGKVLGYVVYTSDLAPTNEALTRARQAMADRERLAKTINAIATSAHLSGRPLGPKQKAILAYAAKLLGETAQPASVFATTYGVPQVAGSTFGVAPAAVVAAPAIPPALLVGVAVVAVIVLSAAAAIWYLGEQQQALADAQMKAHEAWMEQTAGLRSCVSDMTLSADARANCAMALKATPPPPTAPKGPADVLEALANAAPYITGLVLLGAGVLYFGPLIGEVGKAGAEGVRAVRQRIPARREIG
jgi:hypothetical protein